MGCRAISVKTIGLLFIFSAAIFAMSGCAHEPQHDYLAQDGDALLQLRSVGMPMNVMYSVSSSESQCEKFEEVGKVRDAFDGVLLPWIASLIKTMSGVPSILDTHAPAGQPIQVKGYSSWWSNSGSGRCGPVVRRFVPDSHGRYRIEFVWNTERSCSMRVLDVTDSERAVEVPSERLFCPR